MDILHLLIFVNCKSKIVVPVLGGPLLGGVLFLLGGSAWAEVSPMGEPVM